MNELKRNAFSDRVRLDSASLRETPLWVRLGAILLVLLLIILLVWVALKFFFATKQSRVVGQGGPVPVNVATVAQGDVRVTVDGLGAVTPLATVTLHPQVTGYLLRFDVTEGQMVKTGQLIAEIDPRPFQAALDQAKGQLARDQSTYENAKIDLGRYQALWKQNAVSQQILQTQIATVGTDKGTVAADKAAVEAAAVNLGFCHVTSPVAGRVGLRQVDPGNLVVSGGSTAIVVVTQLQPMSVLFSLPEDIINQVEQRVSAGDKLTVSAYDRSMTTKLADGTLSNVDNEIDPTTGMVKMRAMFDNEKLTLFPSQFVNIRLLLNTLHNQTYVPAAAIQHGAQGSYLYAIGNDRTAHMVTITTGATDGDKVAIASGVNPGQTVVTDGADRLSDGKEVLLPGHKAASGGAYSAPANASTSQPGAHHGKWNGQHRHGRHHGGDQTSGQSGSQ